MEHALGLAQVLCIKRQPRSRSNWPLKCVVSVVCVKSVSNLHSSVRKLRECGVERQKLKEKASSVRSTT